MAEIQCASCGASFATEKEWVKHLIACHPGK